MFSKRLGRYQIRIENAAAEKFHESRLCYHKLVRVTRSLLLVSFGARSEGFLADRDEIDSRQRVLATFGDFVLDNNELDAILTEACRLIAEVLKTDYGKVIQIEPSLDTGLIRAGIGWNHGVVGQERISLAENSSEAFAIKTSKPVITRDIAEEKRFHFPKFLRDHGVKSIVNVPIFLPGRHPWGLLQVDAREPRDFDLQDIEFLKICSTILGPVIDRLQAVDEREEARASLSQREARLHRVLDGMGEGFAILDPDFVIIEFNREASQIEGRAAESVIGRSHWDVYPGSKETELGRALQNAMNERKPAMLEHQISVGDGPGLWIEMRAYPNDDGTLAVFWRDVSQRKASLDELQQSEQWLRNAIEVGKIGLWDWDVRTGEVSWSEEHFRMFGYGIDEVSPSYQVWLSRIHDEDRGRENAKIQACMNTRDDYSSEYRVVHSDGSLHWVKARARFSFDKNGAPVQMVGAAIDVTEPRELQERQSVLVAELQHRTRNLISIVRSLSDKTARSSADFPDFRVRYHSRLDVLARVQGRLSQLGIEERVTFDELIASEIAAVSGGDIKDRLSLEGPRGIRLRSSTVQTLAMAFHELATNALKYGALRHTGAKLAIHWTFQPADGEQSPWLHVEWRETGVKIASENRLDKGSGHGRELIEKALPYQLGALTTFGLGEDGAYCTISIPVSTKRTSDDG